MKSQSERRKTAKCHSCGEIGHVKFDCPKSKPSEPLQIPETRERLQIKNFDAILRYCREFRYNHVTIFFKNGGKGYIYCTYEENKKKGKVGDCQYERDTIEKLSNIKYKSVKHFWKNITKYGTPIRIYFSLCYYSMIKMLNEKGLVKYTYVAEDKRSGCNLIKFLEIDGVSVEHNVHQDCIRSETQGQFYPQIVKLFETNIMAPRYCRETILFVFWINKNHLWGFIVKDVLLIILKQLWATRRHRCWKRNSVGKKFNLDVLY